MLGLFSFIIGINIPRFFYTPKNSNSYPGVFQIKVGSYNVTIYPSEMPELLEDVFPGASSHSILKNFLETYNPIWAEEIMYYNTTINASRLVTAGALMALNQSGFWQLVFSTNGTQSEEIQWTCRISGNRMPINWSSIIKMGADRLLFHLPEEPIRLYRFYLTSDYTVKNYQWDLRFAVQSDPWTSFKITIDTNGTVINEHLFMPPGGSEPFTQFQLILIAGAGTVILVVVIVSYVRFRRKI